MMISKMASVLWANTIVKHPDVFLSRLSLDMTFEHHMELKGTSNFPTKDLMPSDLILKVAEKSGLVFRTEAIRKAVSLKPQDHLSSSFQP